MPDFWVISHTDNSLSIHPLDPRDEDRFLPFLNLERVPLLPLEVHLPFTYETALAGVESRQRRKDELRAARDKRGLNGRIECGGVRDELAEGCAGLHVCRGKVRHELFSSDSVEVVFERFEFLPQGLYVVERDLDGAVVDFAEGVHLLLFFPCCGCLYGRVGLGGEWGRGKLRVPRLI